MVLRIGPAALALGLANLGFSGVKGTVDTSADLPHRRPVSGVPPAACPPLAVRAAWAMDVDGDGLAELVLSDGERRQVLVLSEAAGRYVSGPCPSG